MSERAPDAVVVDRATHEWKYDGHCRTCGVDRFSRDGLRDGQPCYGKPERVSPVSTWVRR